MYYMHGPDILSENSHQCEMQQFNFQDAVMRSCRVSLPAVSGPECCINHGADSGTLSDLQYPAMAPT